MRSAQPGHPEVNVMTRTSTVLILALMSSILTPVVVSATGAQADKPAAPVQQIAQVQLAQAETAVPSVATAVVAAPETPTCTRRIKVVYAGYGEARADACAVAADTRR
jgi:hypothetical protein